MIILTYPGVYIEEVSTGGRSITGVATSVTAFVGSAARGTSHERKIVPYRGESERSSGGLFAVFWNLRAADTDGNDVGRVIEDQLRLVRDPLPPRGAVPGAGASTEADRGTWRASVGQEATIADSAGVAVALTSGEDGQLNSCLRTPPAIGNVGWRARAMDGADSLASEWKYTPVRRLALFLEEYLSGGTEWVVFEPSVEPFRGLIRFDVAGFMQNLFRQGTRKGATPRGAYVVKCDKATTARSDGDVGILSILVGFARC